MWQTWLALIALGQAAGFSLDEVGAMLVDLQVDRQMLIAKADELDARIRRLQAMSKGLRHAAQCPEEDHLACPKFQRLMKLSAAGVLGEKQSKNEGVRCRLRFSDPRNGGGPTSHTPALDVPAMAAPFRA